MDPWTNILNLWFIPLSERCELSNTEEEVSWYYGDFQQLAVYSGMTQVGQQFFLKQDKNLIFLVCWNLRLQNPVPPKFPKYRDYNALRRTQPINLPRSALEELDKRVKTKNFDVSICFFFLEITFWQSLLLWKRMYCLCSAVISVKGGDWWI